MERIGLVASKIAKGNLFLYNVFVILITMLFALLVFLIAGCAIVLVLTIVAYLASGDTIPDLEQGWISAMVVCMVCLAAVVGGVALFAILKNFKFKKR